MEINGFPKVATGCKNVCSNQKKKILTFFSLPSLASVKFKRDPKYNFTCPCFVNIFVPPSEKVTFNHSVPRDSDKGLQ